MKDSKIGLLVINGPVPPPYGGIATYLSFTLPYLVRNGFDVYTIIDAPPTNQDLHNQHKSDGLHLYYGKSSRKQRLLAALRHPFLWGILYFRSRLSFRLFLETINSISRWLDVAEKIIKSADITIVHAYDYPWAQGWVASYLGRKYKKKYVQTTFGEVVPHQKELEQYDARSKLFKNHVNSVLRTANLIISVSRHCSQVLRYVDIKPETAKISYHGVNISLFHPNINGNRIREEYNLGNDPIVLFAGQIRLRKGPQVLLEAIPHILKEIPHSKFLFVGPDGGIASNLKQKAVYLSINDNTIFTGSVDDEKLPLFFSACDVFVFPTVTPIECLGLTMIQAMACGKPVVGSNINGIPEVIVDGETGFLVEPNNPLMLSEKVVKLLDNPTLRMSMGEKGWMRATTMFSQEQLAKELSELYLSILNKDR